MNVFFVVDEYTDVEPAPVVREMIGIVIDALHNPDKPRPEGEILLGEVTRQYVPLCSVFSGCVVDRNHLGRFWARGRTTATPEAAKHFVEAFTDYLNSVITQAEDRDNDTHRTIDTYLQTRRENIGARPSYVPGELHLSIPDEAFYHPVIKELEYLIADLIILDNVGALRASSDDRGC